MASVVFSAISDSSAHKNASLRARKGAAVAGVGVGSWVDYFGLALPLCSILAKLLGIYVGRKFNSIQAKNC